MYYYLLKLSCTIGCSLLFNYFLLPICFDHCSFLRYSLNLLLFLRMACFILFVLQLIILLATFPILIPEVSKDVIIALLRKLYSPEASATADSITRSETIHTLGYLLQITPFKILLAFCVKHSKHLHSAVHYMRVFHISGQHVLGQ